jgi:hypothetical protein
MAHFLPVALVLVVLESSAIFANAQNSDPYNRDTLSNPLSRDLYGRPVVPPPPSGPSYGYGGNSNPYAQPPQPRYEPAPVPHDAWKPHDFSVFEKGQYRGMCTATKDTVYCW